MFYSFRAFLVLLAAVVLLVSAGCDPLPRRKLEINDRVADAYWIDTQLREYAPMEYKQKLLNFDYNKAFDELLAKVSRPEVSNQEHMELMQAFVARFADAHTSTQILPSNLPGRVEIAYLGFSGYRMGDDLVVTEVLPSINGGLYPLQIGDRVTKMDGLSLPEYIEKNLVKYRNLGDHQANATFHMNNIFTRVSTENGTIARGSDAVVTVKRPSMSGWKDENITLPWVVKDLYDFDVDKARLRDLYTSGKIWGLKVSDRTRGGKPFEIGLLDNSGRPYAFNRQWSDASKKYRKALKYLNGFSVNLPMRWTADAEKLHEAEKTAFERLKAERKISADALRVDVASTFPAYFVLEDELNAEGEPTGKKRGFGYIRIDTFSPMAPEEMVISELKDTLDVFQRNGVKDIVVDQLNNGGGSVTLVMQVAQAFSNKKIQTFGIQFGLGDNWLDSFERGELWGPNDAERELQRRLLEKLEKEQAEGKRISSVYPIESLVPYQLKPNDRIKEPFNIVLLINEMSASAADMFPAMMKDNGLATLMGRKTMGAGGNVVTLMSQSPGIRLRMNRTESLLVRPNGEYIENVGVTPHVEVDPTYFAMGQYEGLVSLANDYLKQGPVKFKLPDLTMYKDCKYVLEQQKITVKK